MMMMMMCSLCHNVPYHMRTAAQPIGSLCCFGLSSPELSCTVECKRLMPGQIPVLTLLTF